MDEYALSVLCCERELGTGRAAEWSSDESKRGSGVRMDASDGARWNNGCEGESGGKGKLWPDTLLSTLVGLMVEATMLWVYGVLCGDVPVDACASPGPVLMPAPVDEALPLML